MIARSMNAATRIAAVTLALATGTLIAASAAMAQATPGSGPMKEDKPGQLARARITPDSARHLARTRVAKAVIAEEGIEMEKGKLVYSFDMKTAGRSGIDEVLIDAQTGAVISVDHETPAQEAAERAHDAHESRAKSPGARRP